MTRSRSRIAAALTAASLALGWAAPGLAQDPAPEKKDEGLEKLLEKLDESKAPRPGEAEKPKPPGEVAPKDQALDKLLEGLGQSKDAPAPDDKKPGGPGGDPMPPKPDQPRPDELKGGEKDLDDILKGLNGKKEKPKKERDKKEEEGSGPLGQVVKEMRDVEERLGQPDTGEETRKKQSEIVKNLDGLIEQLKNAQSQSQGMKMIRQGQKPGQPGNQPGDQPGATAQGTGKTRPETPKTPPAVAGLGKEIWGQLPSQFRDEMANVLNEHPLPTRTDLIRLYYLSLGKKSADRGE